MVKITLNTNGNSISVSISKIFTSMKLNNIPYMVFKIGDAHIDINFETPNEMIEFCKKHNFEYEDERIK